LSEECKVFLLRCRNYLVQKVGSLLHGREKAKGSHWRVHCDVIMIKKYKYLKIISTYNYKYLQMINIF
jgi:hypothetical protein